MGTILSPKSKVLFYYCLQKATLNEAPRAKHQHCHIQALYSYRILLEARCIYCHFCELITEIILAKIIKINALPKRLSKCVVQLNIR